MAKQSGNSLILLTNALQRFIWTTVTTGLYKYVILNEEMKESMSARSVTPSQNDLLTKSSLVQLIVQTKWSFFLFFLFFQQISTLPKMSLFVQLNVIGKQTIWVYEQVIMSKAYFYSIFINFSSLLSTFKLKIKINDKSNKNNDSTINSLNFKP